MQAKETATNKKARLFHPEYRADIDGLRALAVLSVIGFHYFPEWINGGYIGVDIFFVISGFLISRILFKSFTADSFSYAEFYYRRIKRIFPALLLVLSSTLAIGWFILFSDEYDQLGKHTIGGLSFVSNFILWNEHGYFDTLSSNKPLLHLWSLGVEEQFYIIWPLILVATWKRNIVFLNICLLIAGISFLINIFTSYLYPVASFYSPLGRFWELMAGSVLAYGYSNIQKSSLSRTPIIPLAGLTLIALGIILISTESSFPGWWALLPVFGASLIVYSHPENTVNKNFLSNPILVWFGLISYPLYLWHWPILSLVTIYSGPDISLGSKLFLISISIMLAWLTYIFIEKPVKSLNNKRSAVLLIILSVIIFLFAIFVWKHQIFSRNNIPQIEAAISDWDYPTGLTEFEFEGQTYYKKGDNPEQVLFLGDSLMEQYSPRVVSQLNLHPTTTKSVVFATAAGCPPIPLVFEENRPKCESAVSRAIKYANNESIDTIVIGAYWSGYFILHTAPETNGDYRYYYLNENKKEYFVNGRGSQLALNELADFLKSLANPKRVYLILTNPTGDGFHPKNHVTGTRLSGITFRGGNTLSLTHEQLSLRKSLITLSQIRNVTVIDPAKALCPTGQCSSIANNGELKYQDNIHMRPFYVRDHAGFIDEAIRLP